MNYIKFRNEMITGSWQTRSPTKMFFSYTAGWLKALLVVAVTNIWTVFLPTHPKKTSWVMFPSKIIRKRSGHARMWLPCSQQWVRRVLWFQSLFILPPTELMDTLYKQSLLSLLLTSRNSKEISGNFSVASFEAIVSPWNPFTTFTFWNIHTLSSEVYGMS